MTPLFYYFLKASVALTLFYAFYRLLFDRDTFFDWKRAVLMGSVVLSTIYPFIDISGIWELNEPVKESIILYSTVLPEIKVNVATHKWWEVNNLPNAIRMIYVLGVFLLLIRFIIQFASILRLVSQGNKSTLDGTNIIQLKGNTAPFSFFNWIFINPEIHNENDLKEILTHERTHVREWHSIDVILSELACIAFWFNPFVWLTKIAIRQNLEFLADNRVIVSGYDCQNYQYHLLRLTHQSAAANLINNFNVSELKKRIIMMNKKKSSSLGLTKYALLIPLVSVLLITNQAEVLAKKVNSKISSSKTDNTEITPPAIPNPNSGNGEIAPPPPPPPIIGTEKNTPIFMQVEQMPEYPGGIEGLMNYLAKNIRYPKDAQEQGIQGRVIVRFIVNKMGEVENTEVLRGVTKSLDDEAIRVVSAMQKWTPGKQKGVNVAVYYTLPIDFRLADNQAKKGDKELQVYGYGKNSNIKKDDVKPPTLSPDAIFFVDGIETSSDAVKKIDPNTIEKMEVLKEKTAIARYGEKGKNGVVLITMKKK
ncbi:MAG: TonB family protein [Bacteroidales bacterium]|nr:TonB family protein [Bacteroidales bacterium]